MQNLDYIKKCSGVLDIDFLDWKDDSSSENKPFSDTENIFKSRNLIENLQHNGISISNNVSHLLQEKLTCHKKISKLNWKEMKLPKLGTLNTSHDRTLLKEHKEFDILNKKKSSSKNCDECSDSEDFCSPNKKRKISEIHSVNSLSIPVTDYIRTCIPIHSGNLFKENDRSLVKGISLQVLSKPQSDLMVISRRKTSGIQTEDISNQESCDSKMITSSQEISNRQKTSMSQEKMSTSSQETSSSQQMCTSSQENLARQKMNRTSQEISITKTMFTSSQESSVGQNIICSQESCTSPQEIASSQESLGNQVMNISIEEDSNILNVASQFSSCETQVVITPHKNSSSRQGPTHEEAKSFKSNTMHQSVNSKKLKLCNQRGLGNDTFSRKRKKTDSSDKDDFTKILVGSVSDSFDNKTLRRCNKTEKRMTWNIRRRELEVTKREKEIEIREKHLDAREADIIKREEILKAKRRRYFFCKTNVKKFIQKQIINPKELRQRMGVLVDETNAFNPTCS